MTTKKSVLCKVFCLACLSILLGSCEHLDGLSDPEFNKMKFRLDYNQQEVVTKSKWGNWSIKSLSLDGHELDFFTNPANAEEMELNGMTLKIKYEREYENNFSKPCKISGDYFEIVKPSEKKLIIKLDENLTGKERLIKIYPGDGNYNGSIDITQSEK